MHTRVNRLVLSFCLLLSAFSYAQTQNTSLGTNFSSAINITDTTTVSVVDGTENYFKIEAEHLPATVCYFQDTAFGPIPQLICIDDTLPAVMVTENCRMGWRWELSAAGEEESVRYLYFSSHENASAEIRPFVCQPINTTDEPGNACGELMWGQLKIEETGTYTQTFTAANGCDSIVTKYVFIAQESDPTHIQITAYDQYTWYGVTYTQSQSHLINTDTNIDGCDSIINLDLTIRHLKKDTIRPTICSNEAPFYWRGNTYTAGGVYTLDTVYSSISDMDTLYTLDLTINPTYAVDTSATACDSYVWRGQTYSESGEYPFNGQTKAGCDSIVTLHLTINHSASADTSATACDSYVWRGQTYTESGAYPYHGQTQAGCDSVVTLHLTINHPSAGEETRSEYDSYTWHGTTYTESGDYTYHTTNAAGCDSTATLHLTILVSVITYDTVYFCAGMNTEHEEKIDPSHVRRYVAYTYESPAEWDYMEGVILTRERDRMQVDLQRAEQNLLNHYTDGLVPVNSIAWSYRPEDATGYQPLEVSNTPQWVATGTVSVTVRFVCGQLFVSDFAADIQTVSDEETSGKKVLENGQIIIIRGGHKYTLLGTKID